MATFTLGDCECVKAKRRTGIEVTRDILEVCVVGAGRTRIVYRANLNSERLNGRLEALSWMGLLLKESNGDGRVSYKTTVQGVRFLEGYFGERRNMKVILE